jgi:hypothetical protein
MMVPSFEVTCGMKSVSFLVGSECISTEPVSHLALWISSITA